MPTTWPADRVERKAIDALIPYARNARTHSDAQVAQIAEWLALVSALPADWFPRETHGLLTDYCRHVVRSRRVALLIGVVESGDMIDIGKLDLLYKMAERESRAASSLATRLRITPQATRSTYSKKPPATRKPWEA